MIHVQRSLTWLCVGLVVFAAITASVAGELAALLTPLWLLCADLAVRVRRRIAAHRDERPLSRRATAPSRAPPSRFAHA